MWSVRIRALQGEWEAGVERANDALLTEIILKPVGAQRATLSGVMGPMPARGPHRGQDLVQAPGWRPLCAPGRLWAEGALPSWPLHWDQEGRSLWTWRQGVKNRLGVWLLASHTGPGKLGCAAGVTQWKAWQLGWQNGSDMEGASGAQGLWPTGGHFCAQVFLSCPWKASHQTSHDPNDGLNKGLEQRQAIRFKKGTAF